MVLIRETLCALVTVHIASSFEFANSSILVYVWSIERFLDRKGLEVVIYLGLPEDQWEGHEAVSANLFISIANIYSPYQRRKRR